MNTIKTCSKYSTPAVSAHPHRRSESRALLVTGILGLFSAWTAMADINLGNADPYTILYGGTGQLSFSASSEIGNIGVGNKASVFLNPTSSVKGNVDFAGPSIITGGSHVTGSINTSVGSLSSAFADINSLSTSMAGLSGNNLSIRLPGDQTIHAADGKKNGNNYVFNVTDFKFEGGKVLTINGDNLDGNIVFNFNSFKKVDFNGTINLTGGLCSDDVLWNFTGGRTALGTKGNAGLDGIFLNPNGSISFGGNTDLGGRLFGGAGNDIKIIENSQIEINECPEPSPCILFGLGALIFGIMCRRTA